MRHLLLKALLLLLLLLPPTPCSGWLSSVGWTVLRRPTTTAKTAVVQVKKQSRVETVLVAEEEETPAGIEGAQFFGGNKQKEEFFDATAEAEADLEIIVEEEPTYSRFADTAAFVDAEAAALALSVQEQINAVLFGEPAPDAIYTYADSNLQWETDLQVKAPSPLAELENALEFYRRVDVAVTSGQRKGDDRFELRFEISVAWPTFWEPRVLLTGTSEVTVRDKTIVRQVDRLDSGDMMSSIVQQVVPRFWDVYHIGMTPSAEIAPRLPVKGKSPLAPYQLSELPPRLVLQPSMLDLGDREDGNAAVIPNHAFSCVIKTMGPERQRYQTASPVEVQILPQRGGPLKLRWNVPVATEYLSNPVLTLPGPDWEQDEAARAACQYQWLPRRKVATVAYGGSPQDPAVTELRKKLYEQVTKDGLKPKVDDNGRPIFFFLQNAVKACYTQEGLGMAVYEWRPRFVKPNEVGIELEL